MTSEREILTVALAQVARRLRLNHALKETAAAACWLIGAILVYQILRARIAAPAVLSAIQALVMIALIVIAALFAWRLRRKLTLAHAAGVIDQRAQLRDELKSAHWFAAQPAGSVLMKLQVQRAALSAQRINAAKLVPILAPPGAALALALAVASIALAWAQPHLGLAKASVAAKNPAAGELFAARITPVETKLAATETTAAQDANLAAQQAAAVKPTQGRATLANNGADAPAREAQAAQWVKLERAVRALGVSADTEGIAAAVKARDAKRAHELLEQLQHQRAKTHTDRVQLAGGVQAAAIQRNPGLVSALQDLFNQQMETRHGNLPGASAEAQRAIEGAQKLDNERNGGASSDDPAQHTPQEMAANPIDGAIPLARYGERNAARGDGESGDPAGATSVEGGALGRRISQTRAGEGGNPDGSASGNAEGKDEAAPVLGKQTLRLEAKLRRLKIQSETENGAAEGSADRFYAATRSQQSKYDYQVLIHKPRYTDEAAMNGERVPLAYRAAVKEYFLNLRQNKE